MKVKLFWLVPLLFPLALLATYEIVYLNRSYPGITSFGQTVGNKDASQIQETLTQSLPSNRTITLKWGTSQWHIQTTDIDLIYDAGQTATQILALGWQNSLTSWKTKIEVPIVFSLDENKLTQALTIISSGIDIPAKEPEVVFENDQIVVHTGDNGRRVDDRQLLDLIRKTLAQPDEIAISIPVVEVTPQISSDQAEALKVRAEKLLNKELTLEFENQAWDLNFTQLITWLDVPSSNWKTLAIEAWVAGLSDSVNRPADNALFSYSEGRVHEFRPARTGIVVQQDQLIQTLVQQLTLLETSNETQVKIAVPVVASQPTIKTADVNDLGIKELIGRGESDYSGSIPNRIFNLTKAANNMHGVLIAPGEIFSFNKYVGDISTTGGYKQAYIIKEGKTILGDGGGVCQISTTMFRAALNTGLPIEERTAHAYRVHYYENDSLPGVDATIFTPTTDFKFKNDTPGHILIQMKHDSSKRKLVFEFYGTSDGRMVNVSKPKVWGITPPPPAVYQDDPTLSKGVVKQVDWSAPGTKTSFDYRVTRNGETLQNRTFYSNYRAWQAVYLRGTL